ncbi:hypothetical protein LTR91_018709 [Friedmanniomyces endolithicus]|uniref:Uncharacterized protein n=1 Tax=Friedmanniomyces endolithicus TaxID=329885 RepID=A0AAN6K4J2_9PEZI|nr:hypothetical protein LTR91_018709 [Friedmanniomyces endolithicus]
MAEEIENAGVVVPRAMVDPRFDVPVNSIIFTTIFTAVISLINIGSTVAFNAMLSLSTTALMRRTSSHSIASRSSVCAKSICRRPGGHSAMLAFPSIASLCSTRFGASSGASGRTLIMSLQQALTGLVCSLPA